MPISVSAFYPDTQLRESEFSNALTKVAINLVKLKNQITVLQAPEIELHFMLTGRYDSPGFSGMRIKTFDSKQAKILIEAAVPCKINNSTNASKYIVAALQDAVENAADFLNEINMEFDQSAYMAVLENVSDNSIAVN